MTKKRDYGTYFHEEVLPMIKDHQWANVLHLVGYGRRADPVWDPKRQTLKTTLVNKQKKALATLTVTPSYTKPNDGEFLCRVTAFDSSGPTVSLHKAFKNNPRTDAIEFMKAVARVLKEWGRAKKDRALGAAQVEAAVYYRLQPTGLSIQHNSTYSDDTKAAGLMVFSSPLDVFRTHDARSAYGDEVVCIEAASHKEHGDAEGVLIEPQKAKVIARIPLKLYAELMVRLSGQYLVDEDVEEQAENLDYEAEKAIEKRLPVALTVWSRYLDKLRKDQEPTQAELLQALADRIEAGPDRVPALMKKYPEYADWVQYLADHDVTGTQKYLDWAVRIFVSEFPLNTDNPQAFGAYVAELVRQYHEIQKLLGKKAQVNKDINKYKTTRYLDRSMDQDRRALKEIREHERAGKPPKVVFEKDGWKVTELFSREQLCTFGEGTEWCVSKPPPDPGLSYDSYMDKKDPRFFVVTSPDHNKFLAFFSGGVLTEFRDKSDSSLLFGQPPYNVLLDVAKKLGLTVNGGTVERRYFLLFHVVIGDVIDALEAYMNLVSKEPEYTGNETLEELHKGLSEFIDTIGIIGYSADPAELKSAITKVKRVLDRLDVSVDLREVADKNLVGRSIQVALNLLVAIDYASRLPEERVFYDSVLERIREYALKILGEKETSTILNGPQ